MVGVAAPAGTRGETLAVEFDVGHGDTAASETAAGVGLGAGLADVGDLAAQEGQLAAGAIAGAATEGEVEAGGFTGFEEAFAGIVPFEGDT